MSKSLSKRFVGAAWALLSFQFVASVGAVAVTGLAAMHVSRIAAELEATRAPAQAAEQATDQAEARADEIGVAEPERGVITDQPRAEAEVRPQESAASPITPCQRQENVVRVMANVEWCDSGIQVQRGQRLVFIVRGNWSHSGEPVLDPGGSDVSEPRAVFRRASHGALIGRAGETIFLIGAGGEIQAPADGALQFSINDIPGQFRDNPGYVDIFLQLAQQPRAAPAN